MDNKNEIWVSKFGGTSLANASQIEKVKELVLADTRRQIVVVSAPGKEYKEDTKITDLLLNCHSLIMQGRAFDTPFATIRKRFLEIASNLGVGQQIAKELDTIYTKLPQEKSADYAASRGEYLNALMLSEYFGAEFVDAEDIIRLTPQGQVDERSYALITERLAKRGGRVVIPGFYGLNAAGSIQTFSRGGSDISGAIVARAVKATIYENWTDVSGIYLADPRLVQGVGPVDQITYREIRELSCIGASVLHEDAIAPVRKAGIPIHIKNTNDPLANGTIITGNRNVDRQHIVGVSGKKGYRKLIIESTHASIQKEVQSFLANRKISYDIAIKAFDEIVFYLSTPLDKVQTLSLRSELLNAVETDSCELSEPLVLIGIVGEGLVNETQLTEQICQALAKKGLTPAVLADIFKMKMLFALPEEAYATALQTIVEMVLNC